MIDIQVHLIVSGTDVILQLVGLECCKVVPSIILLQESVYSSAEMSCEEILKVVFPLLQGRDLATCMLVCKQWREVARDDYIWKCLCAKRWPSVCKQSSPPILSYHKLFKSFYKRQKSRTLLPPRLSFNDLEFYIDIWAEDKLMYSEVVPGPVLQKGTWTPPTEISDVLRLHLSSPDYKMTLPMQPRFNIPMGQTVSASVFAGRNDSQKVACIINKSRFDYIDRSTYRALAFDYLDFSPAHPFVSGIRAWISLLFMDHGSESLFDVFGIELDFCDAANSEDHVLWLLDMLDWK